MTVKLWGRSLAVIDKQIGVDLCSPGHVHLSVCLSLFACFILADIHVCVFIHNAVTTVAASSYAFISILKVFRVFLNLFHSVEIHQAGSGKTTEEQRSIEECGAHQRKQWLLNY